MKNVQSNTQRQFTPWEHQQEEFNQKMLADSRYPKSKLNQEESAYSIQTQRDRQLSNNAVSPKRKSKIHANIKYIKKKKSMQKSKKIQICQIELHPSSQFLPKIQMLRKQKSVDLSTKRQNNQLETVPSQPLNRNQSHCFQEIQVMKKQLKIQQQLLTVAILIKQQLKRQRQAAEKQKIKQKYQYLFPLLSLFQNRQKFNDKTSAK